MGFFCGVMFDNDMAARGLLLFMGLLFMLTGGGFNNAASYPIYVQIVSYLSPNRYGTEVFIRRITSGR